ncbi:DUF2878 family protein [Desulfosudis oleivorans]|uniref:Uncharacterized protein n=1 Tax=Desulfosudis oleivorans (strain DSM 6200 / JCM 39069 / Hxd3) TaxID=96561 RepID=A8ZXQ7_DESOH|nr:DUF2878 family protein [Desulfosudis oleivorans]ABW67015.1 hypothetical protein Dole_1209 [Desulfosudis oleivorans Hxd3]
MQKTKSPYINMLPLALLAASLATFCDAIHVHTHTLAYPDPWLFGQAFWVLPGFFVTFMTMSVGYFWMAPALPKALPTGKSTSAGAIGPCVEALISFGMVYLLSGFGNREPVLLSAIFYGVFALRLTFTYEKGFLLVLALILAVAGMFAEGLISAMGQVNYREPEIFHVPFWLGALYMHGAFALREGMRCFVYGR